MAVGQFSPAMLHLMLELAMEYMIGTMSSWCVSAI